MIDCDLSIMIRFIHMRRTFLWNQILQMWVWR